MSDRAIDSGNPGNFSGAAMTAKASAQEDYYRYMLLKERLGENNAILKAKSEKDIIMEEILAKLVNVRESTAEWSEVVALTGSENRFSQAERLAEIAWEKRRAELVLAKYTGGDTKLTETYNQSQAMLANVRTATAASARSPVAAALSAATGGVL